MNAALRFRFPFFLSICLCFTIVLTAQNFTCTVQHPPTDAAWQAYTRQDYPKAFDLYSAAAKSNPKDVEAVAGQVRSLLEEQQVDAAANLAESSLTANKKSAVLETVLGEVRFRQGRLTDAVHAYGAALKLDPCLARTRFELYRITRVESMYRSAHEDLQVAHLLDPDDPDIHLAWIRSLPLVLRSKEIDAYLANSTDRTLAAQNHMEEYAERLHAILASQNGHCHLASHTSTAIMPFEFLEPDQGGQFHALGFDVKVNNKAKARLELDTGASGILLDRGTAKKAGLVPIASDKISGIGDQKVMTGYWAYADDFRVGPLEFKDCMVEVSDRRSIVGVDGLIGADVFENYHVQLDFPLRRMTLSPLPPRPGEVRNNASLNASGMDSAHTSAAANPEKKTGAAATPPEIHYYDRYASPEMKSWSPFARFGHEILINGYLKDRKPRLFLLDSGASLTTLSILAAKSVGKVHSEDETKIVGINGHVNKLYTTDSVDVYFAGLRAPFGRVFVMNLDRLSAGAGTEVSGIVGLNTLIYLTVDIDYRDGLIHLAFDPKHGANRSANVY